MLLSSFLGTCGGRNWCDYKQVATSLHWKVSGIVISVLRGIFWVEEMVSSASEIKLMNLTLSSSQFITVSLVLPVIFFQKVTEYH